MPHHRLLIALDSVGIDPLGHDRPESVYGASRFLFPRGRSGAVVPVNGAPVPGILVETDVAGEAEQGAIECAITYTSTFSGQSAIREHGLMRGLGLKDRLLEQMVSRDNLFRHFPRCCLANSIFPAHVEFLGNSYAQDLVPHFSREAIEGRLTFDCRPTSFRGHAKNGFAVLFTLAEINQNIFVYAARGPPANLPLCRRVSNRAPAPRPCRSTGLPGEFNTSFFQSRAASRLLIPP